MRDEESLLLAPRSWYAAHGIELRLNDPVVEVDCVRRVVRARSGAVVAFDRLVFATGSYSFVPPIEGAGLPGVFAYRMVDDLEAIREYARGGTLAAVLGGGLLGLEAARALRDLVLDVMVIEVAPTLMPSQLDPEGAALLGRAVTAHGIDGLTSVRVVRIERRGGTRRLRLANEDCRDVEMVVIAAGVRLRTELAKACGLTCTARGGILVDERLRTSDPHIYAIGECAAPDAHGYGLVAPGYRMADAVADNLAGRRVTFSDAPVTTRLKLLGTPVAATGEALAEASSVTFSAPGVYRKLRLRQGRLIGALGVGDWPDFGRIQEAAARGRRIWPRQQVHRSAERGRVVRNLSSAARAPHRGRPRDGRGAA